MASSRLRPVALRPPPFRAVMARELHPAGCARAMHRTVTSLFLRTLLCLFALAAHGETGAPEVRMELTVEPLEVTLGQPFSVTITVEYPPEMEVQLATPAADWGSLAVKESGPSQRSTAEDGWVRQTVVHVLAAFELGTLEILPLDLRITQGDQSWNRSTPGGTVLVRSTLPQDHTEEAEPQLADLKEQASLQQSRVALLLFSALALLLLALLVYYLWRRRRQEAAPGVKAPPVPSIPADQEALQALQELQAGPLLMQGKIKEYHVQLAEIVKRYLERRFGVATLERTSFEVIQATRLAPVDVWVPGRVASLLDGCDFVKFARQRPDLTRCRHMVDEARALVEQTRPIVQTSVAGQAAEGGA